MAYTPVSLDHVNIFVRNAERSHRWYTDVFGLHTQDTMMSPETGRLRAAFLAADPDHAHDIALFEVGEDAPGQEKGQVGLNHVAWKMASLDDLKEMYHPLAGQGRSRPGLRSHRLHRHLLVDDPDGNGLEVYYELPRSQWNRERPFSGEGQKGRFPGPWDEVLRRQSQPRA